jgi:hypothetical protein
MLMILHADTHSLDVRCDPTRRFVRASFSRLVAAILFLFYFYSRRSGQLAVMVKYAAVLAAAQRIRGSIYRTPVLTSEFVDLASGVQCYFKAEHLQRTGSFKMRGAANAVFNPDPNLTPTPTPALTLTRSGQRCLLASECPSIARLRGSQCRQPRGSPRRRRAGEGRPVHGRGSS